MMISMIEDAGMGPGMIATGYHDGRRNYDDTFDGDDRHGSRHDGHGRNGTDGSVEAKSMLISGVG